MSNLPPNPPSAFALRCAVNDMAARYGESCMDFVTAQYRDGDVQRHSRALTRRYRALLRLTAALSRLAEGGAR